MNYAMFRNQLAYTRGGSGPPLLLLHGFTGSGAEWAGLWPRLGERRELIAPDLIGHGRSFAPADPARYTMERCVADLLGLLDELGLACVDLLGYSMGGRVALQLAAAAPERVGHLILESASPGLAEPGERAARMASDETLAAWIEQEGLEWFVDHWAAIPLFASQAALPAAVRAELRARRLRGSTCGYANSLRGMGTGRQTSLWGRLPQLAMPTLLISGELDVKYVALGAQMAALLPNTRHIVVPAAGHTVHLEQPERFAELVLSFL
jgi:2-succinyl-6-hydroxy-2,4-cyclohexadiene-1-carboxylate synthase